MNELMDECLTVAFGKYTIIESLSQVKTYLSSASYRVYKVDLYGIKLIGAFTRYLPSLILLNEFNIQRCIDDYYFLYYGEYVILIYERNFPFKKSYGLYCYKKLNIQKVNKSNIRFINLEINNLDMPPINEWEKDTIYFKYLNKYNDLKLFMKSIDKYDSIIQFESFCFLKRIK